MSRFLPTSARARACLAAVAALAGAAALAGPAAGAGTTQIATGAMLGDGHDERAFYVRQGAGPWGPTYPDGPAEARGRLFNFRAANAIFDDDDRADDDPAANTAAFIARMPEYRSFGVLAYTVSLQGGHPGYEGGRISAFTADGALRADWAARAGQVIDAADAQGQVIVLTLFYQRQDQVLADDAAVRNAVLQATDWLIAQGHRNVVIEIANEWNAPTYDRAILRTPEGVAELVQLARSRFDGLPYRLPVGVSGRDLEVPAAIRAATDLTIVHGNLTSPSDDGAGVAALVADPSVPGPVLMNEDSNGTTVTAANLAAERQTALLVRNGGGSWGFMWQPYNQSFPFQWAVGPSSDLAGGQPSYFRGALEHIRGITTPPSETVQPAVISHAPWRDVTGVPIGADVTVGFSEPVDPQTVTPGTVRLAPAAGGAQVAATLSTGNGGSGITLDPVKDLIGLTTYRVTVSRSLGDLVGNTMALTYSWQFTTGPDTVRPAVSVTRPPDGATGVALTTEVVAEASEAVDADSVTAGTFTLTRQGGAAVAATRAVSADGSVLTLKPSSPLMPDTLYTAALTTGVRDPAGNDLVARTWSFRTAPAGAGPWIGQNGTVVFEAEDHASATARSGRAWVPGTGDGAVGTSMALTPDVGWGAVLPIASTAPELRFDVIFDKPGSYHVWVRGLSPDAYGNSVHVSLDGQEPSTAADMNAPASGYGTWSWFRTRVTSPAARLEVPTAGLHTVHVYGREDGFVLDRILLTMNNATQPSGGGPAASPRDGGDTTAPAVTRRSPAAGATGVPVGTTVVAGFSEPLDPATVDAASVRLAPAGGGSAVAGTVTLSSDGRTLTLDPAADLAPGTGYAVRVSGLSDRAGVPMAADDAWGFTTAAVPSPPAPPAAPQPPAAPAAAVPPPVARVAPAAGGLRAAWNRRTGRLTLTLVGRDARTVVRVGARVVTPRHGRVVLVRRAPGRLVVRVAPRASAASSVSARAWRVVLPSRGAPRVVRT